MSPERPEIREAVSKQKEIHEDFHPGGFGDVLESFYLAGGDVFMLYTSTEDGEEYLNRARMVVTKEDLYAVRSYRCVGTIHPSN